MYLMFPVSCWIAVNYLMSVTDVLLQMLMNA